jgi:hypothetical protein
MTGDKKKKYTACAEQKPHHADDLKETLHY